MKENRKTELKVGITVIMALLLFILIYGWAKNMVVGSGYKNLTIVFNSVAGLEKGDAVSINGVRKGYVTEIEVAKDSVIVRTTLEPDADIRSDARFTVAMLDLMGGKKVEVYPGKSETPIDYGRNQSGKFEGDIASAMAMLSSVQEDLVIVIREIKSSLTNLNSVIGDKEFTSDVKKSVAGLKNLTEKISAIIAENREGMKKLINTGSQLAENANNFISENKEEIKTAVKQTNELIKNTNELIGRLSKFADEVTNRQNNAGKLLYDDQFLNDLKSTIKQAKDLISTLIKQLEGKGLKVEADVSLF
jgi:phospholipid/cholesterol/gamma-HCH transport system substrate-binding protein